jgi:hypothetical protein
VNSKKGTAMSEKRSEKKYLAKALPLPSLPAPIAFEPTAEQKSLFSVAEQRAIYLAGQGPRDTDWTMGADALQTWKQRIFDYQQQVQQQQVIPSLNQQQSLLGLLEDANPTAEPQDSQDSIDPEALNPFSLPQQNIEFWRWQQTEKGEPALYFVIDQTLPLLLYVGETVQSQKRWKGEHGCKEYLARYRELHYQHHLPTTLGIGFWRNAPQQTRARQKQESALIYKWRSPFNKENWRYWGTPFVG